MNLDMNKPYGQIWGHPSAVYEQGGVLFDGAGDPLSASKIKEDSIESTGQDFQQENAEMFLLNILKDGAVSKNSLYKEVQNNNQDWHSVETVSAKLNIRKYKQGSTEMWKLIEA